MDLIGGAQNRPPDLIKQGSDCRKTPREKDQPSRHTSTRLWEDSGLHMEWTSIVGRGPLHAGEEAPNGGCDNQIT